jgi:hypothetical protein
MFQAHDVWSPSYFDASSGVCNTYYCHRYISSFCDFFHYTSYTMYQYFRFPESVNNKRDNYYSYLKIIIQIYHDSDCDPRQPR